MCKFLLLHLIFQIMSFFVKKQDSEKERCRKQGTKNLDKLHYCNIRIHLYYYNSLNINSQNLCINKR